MKAALADKGDFSMEGLCRSILERHRDTIRVRKPHIAVAKLARIIETILTLSNRQGFHATSLREISAASGVSMGGLYSYFDSKDTLLLMILGQVSAATTSVLENAPEDVAIDPVLHLRWLIETHVALTEAMLPWFVFAFLEAKSFPPAGRRAAVESEEATEAIFRGAIERGARQGCFSVEDPAFAAALLKPLLQDWYVKRAKWRRRGITADGYATRVQTFVEKALGARADHSPVAI
ncbi:TetR family transcriptional regulator [Chelativorans sp. ZYF759]|uniref:TetR/AcrR family transcriptional regulator n=1 Tax=Chelativorans sp. ZYF759 TaxID=2692213 RepID=UPI00145C84DF|nr:TetR/AcrR family transcriptional regulator [Chelativorans sp. ZYF759]NMG41658.1 TetR family transcriptional regulator [Chelativorans sp. ZYF759]